MKSLFAICCCLLTGCVSGPLAAPSAPASSLSDEELCFRWSEKTYTAAQADYRYDVWDEIIARKLFSDAEANAVRAATVGIGMSRLADLCALGRPSSINRTVTSGGAREQWVYRTYGSANARYVYVQRGVVTAFQD